MWGRIAFTFCRYFHQNLQVLPSESVAGKTVRFRGKFQYIFQTKFFPLEFEGISYNSVCMLQQELRSILNISFTGRWNRVIGLLNLQDYRTNSRNLMVSLHFKTNLVIWWCQQSVTGKFSLLSLDNAMVPYSINAIWMSLQGPLVAQLLWVSGNFRASNLAPVYFEVLNSTSIPKYSFYGTPTAGPAWRQAATACKQIENRYYFRNSLDYISSSVDCCCSIATQAARSGVITLSQPL